MPKWGLTLDQQKTKPWGLPQAVLKPAKTITDPVHGDIYITELELLLLDSPPLQRLRRIRQLGTTHLVYPGATHTRFSHSLGALRAAQDLLDAVISQRHGPHPTPDLFAEWESKYSKDEFDRKLGEAIVLARLGALLHDICHVPFGHSVEDDLKILIPHDENSQRLEFLWSQFGPKINAVVNAELKAALRPLILSKEKGKNEELVEIPEPGRRYPFVADIVGNTICADLLDYLQRDHLFTGLPAKLGHRFIDGFYVTRTDHPHQAQRMVIQIARDGRDRSDVVTELFKYLRYRYELSERALVHHAKLAADAMVGKLLEMWRDVVWNDIAAEMFPKVVQRYEPDLNAVRGRLNLRSQNDALKQIDAKTNDNLEEQFLRHGDDGLLENILAQTTDNTGTDKRRYAVSQLASAILERKLFKPIGHGGKQEFASTIYAKYGDRQHRISLEKDVSGFASLEHRWYVVLWIPSPDMRLKAAEVLVDDGSGVCALKDRVVSENRGKEIYDAHKALWAVSVYAHPELRENPELCERILAWLAGKLGGIQWREYVEQPTVLKLVAQEVGKRQALTSSEEKELLKVVGDISAHNGGDTFESIVRRTEQSVEHVLRKRQTELPLEGDSRKKGDS